MIKKLIFLLLGYIPISYSRIYDCSDASKTEKPLHNPSILALLNPADRINLPFNSPYVRQALTYVENEVTQALPSIQFRYESVDEVELRVVDEPNSPSIKNIFTFNRLILTIVSGPVTRTTICNGFVTLVYNSNNEELLNQFNSLDCKPIDEYATQRRRNSWSVGSCSSRDLSSRQRPHSRAEFDY